MGRYNDDDGISLALVVTVMLEVSPSHTELWMGRRDYLCNRDAAQSLKWSE